MPFILVHQSTRQSVSGSGSGSHKEPEPKPKPKRRAEQNRTDEPWKSDEVERY